MAIFSTAGPGTEFVHLVVKNTFVTADLCDLSRGKKVSAQGCIPGGGVKEVRVLPARVLKRKIVEKILGKEYDITKQK